MKEKQRYSWLYVGFFFLMVFLYVIFTNAIATMVPNIVKATLYSDVIFGIFCIIEYWYFVLLKRDYSEEPFPKKAYPSAKGLLLFVILLIPFWYGTQYIGGYMTQHIHDSGFAKYTSIVENDYGLYLFLAICLSPITEEVIFRGLGFAMMRKKINWIVAAIITSVCFAWIHGTYAHLLPAFFVGMLSCWIYEVSGKLSFSILFHMLYNLTTASIVFVLPNYYVNLAIFVSILCVIVFVFVILYVYINHLRYVFLRDPDPDAVYRGTSSVEVPSKIKTKEEFADIVLHPHKMWLQRLQKELETEQTCEVNTDDAQS